MKLETLLNEYAKAKMFYNALYSMTKDYRSQIDSLESQIREKLNLEPLPANELRNLVERLSQ